MQVGAPPGNAFDLVYAKVRDRVWQGLYAMDSVVAESIRWAPAALHPCHARAAPSCATCCRLHAYGDLYSSPGLDLRQKQLFAVGFLASALVQTAGDQGDLLSQSCTLQGPVDMLDELFGHMLAALRFGASQAACQAVLEVAFQLHPCPQVRPPAPSQAHPGL